MCNDGVFVISWQLNYIWNQISQKITAISTNPVFILNKLTTRSRQIFAYYQVTSNYETETVKLKMAFKCQTMLSNSFQLKDPIPKVLLIIKFRVVSAMGPIIDRVSAI